MTPTATCALIKRRDVLVALAAMLVPRTAAADHTIALSSGTVAALRGDTLHSVYRFSGGTTVWVTPDSTADLHLRGLCGKQVELMVKVRN